MEKNKVWCACGGLMEDNEGSTIKCDECNSIVEVDKKATEQREN